MHPILATQLQKPMALIPRIPRRHRVRDAHGQLVVAPRVRTHLASVDADEDLEERGRRLEEALLVLDQSRAAQVAERAALRNRLEPGSERDQDVQQLVVGVQAVWAHQPDLGIAQCIGERGQQVADQLDARVEHEHD